MGKESGRGGRDRVSENGEGARQEDDLDGGFALLCVPWNVVCAAFQFSPRWESLCLGGFLLCPLFLASAVLLGVLALLVPLICSWAHLLPSLGFAIYSLVAAAAV